MRSIFLPKPINTIDSAANIGEMGNSKIIVRRFGQGICTRTTNTVEDAS
jgi:hypothetical protein